MVTANQLYDQKSALQAELSDLRSQSYRSGLKPYTPEWEAQQQQIRGLESQIIGVDNQVASGNYTPDPANTPAASDKASTNDTGTNAEKVTTEKSQSTPPAIEGTQTFTHDQVNKDLTAGNAPNKPGNTTNDDASTNNTKSGTDKIFNAASNPGNPITPSPNVLDQFASYTYSLSWYLLTPQQANVMSSTSKINTNEWSLLMQSGGAAPPVTPSAPAPATSPGNGTLFQNTGAGTTTNSFGQTVNNNLAGGV
jgi:hypothetical protein